MTKSLNQALKEQKARLHTALQTMVSAKGQTLERAKYQANTSEDTSGVQGKVRRNFPSLKLGNQKMRNHSKEIILNLLKDAETVVGWLFLQVL